MNTFRSVWNIKTGVRLSQEIAAYELIQYCTAILQQLIVTNWQKRFNKRLVFQLARALCFFLRNNIYLNKIWAESTSTL